MHIWDFILMVRGVRLSKIGLISYNAGVSLQGGLQSCNVYKFLHPFL